MSHFDADLKNPLTWLLAPLVAPFALLGGCDEDNTTTGTDVDSDTDVDTDSDTDVDTECSALTNVQAITTGLVFTCGLLTSDSAKCWGSNLYGQLGDGTTESKLTPTDVVNLSSDVQDIVAGYFHICALLTSGGVKCWGANTGGPLGDGTEIDSLTPVDVIGLSSGVQAIAAGYWHTCAVLTSGGIKCWGWNGDGQLGNGTTDGALTPVDVVGLPSDAQDIAAGRNHTCALLTSGGVQCWGNNERGQLGDGTFGWNEIKKTPMDVVGLSSGVQVISAGDEHTCAVLTSGDAKCWGYNDFGQLGNGTTDDSPTPVDVVALSSDVQDIEASDEHTCALLTSGGVMCWGDNYHGQLGDGTTESKLTPIDVVNLSSDAQDIAAGGDHTCAVLTSGDVKCWGANDFGELGDGTTEESTMPVDVIDCGD